MDDGPAVAPAELWRGKWKVYRVLGSQQDKELGAKHLHASKASEILTLPIVLFTLYLLSNFNMSTYQKAPVIRDARTNDSSAGGITSESISAQKSG